jgi:hypothetical protein
MLIDKMPEGIKDKIECDIDKIQDMATTWRTQGNRMLKKTGPVFYVVKVDHSSDGTAFLPRPGIRITVANRMRRGIKSDNGSL